MADNSFKLIFRFAIITSRFTRIATVSPHTVRSISSRYSAARSIRKASTRAHNVPSSSSAMHSSLEIEGTKQKDEDKIRHQQRQGQ